MKQVLAFSSSFSSPCTSCAALPPEIPSRRRPAPMATCATVGNGGAGGKEQGVDYAAADGRRPTSPTYQSMDRTGNIVPTSEISGKPDVTLTKIVGKPELVLSWAGGGVFFFWQLGAMKYLAERFDMGKLSMVGASGGALSAVLATCGVNTDWVIQHAYDLSEKYGLKDRSLGLIGALGPIVEEWLNDLLPSNAHELCRGRVTIVVTELPSIQQVGVSDFSSKADLIDACLASSHIPFALDGKMVRMFRNKPCIDGSVPDFFAGNCDLLTQKGCAVVFDYFDDSLLKRKGRMDLIEMKTYDEVQKMYSLGYAYAQKLHEKGIFDNFRLEEILLTESGRVQEVMIANAMEA